MSKRILHVIGRLDRGGAETLITEIYKKVDREKVQFDFFVYGGHGVFDREILALGGKIFYAQKRFNKNPLAYMRELYRFFKSHNEYDVVHCHLTSMAGYILKMAKKANVKTKIAHSHIAGANFMNVGKLRNIVRKRSVKLLRKNADYIFACSKEAVSYLGENNAYKTQIIKNAIDINKFKFSVSDRDVIRQKHNIGHDETLFCHIGRFDYQKNHEYIIDRFYQVHLLNPKTKLVLIGKGDLQQAVLDKVRELNLLGSVIFTGVIENTYAYLSASDAFIFPSRFEGLGIVLIEAQANGLNCLASDRVPKEADATGNVKFIPLENQKEWVDNMLSIKRNYDVAINVKEKIIDAGYDIYSVAEKLTEFYLSV